MVLVRIVFQAKLGHAGKIAAAMKEGIPAMSASWGPRPRHVRILTDLSGQFDTIVQELEFDSLDDFMKGQEAMFADPKWQEMGRSMMEDVLGGSKEYYTIEYQE